jgi:hypothetical protein
MSVRLDDKTDLGEDQKKNIVNRRESDVICYSVQRSWAPTSFKLNKCTFVGWVDKVLDQALSIKTS